MTDKRKQQIEALEQFFKKVQESHPFGLGDHEDYELIRSLLEDLKGEGWISVDERLPEKGALVLIFSHRVSPAEFNNGTFNRYPNFVEGDRALAYTFTDVTHWQPLPEPP